MTRLYDPSVACFTIIYFCGFKIESKIIYCSINIAMKDYTYFSYETSLTHGKGNWITLAATTDFEQVMRIAVENRCLIIAKTCPDNPNEGTYYLKYRDQGARIKCKTTPTQVLNRFYTDDISKRHVRHVWFIHY